MKYVAYIILLIPLIYISLYNDELDFEEAYYTIHTENGHHNLLLKKAISQKQHAQGLMRLESLGSTDGMIFIYDQSDIQHFWMSETYIPLDMIFFDETKKIVHIHKNAKALDEHTLISSIYPAMYVIELNAGQTDKLGIKINDYFVETKQ